MTRSIILLTLLLAFGFGCTDSGTDDTSAKDSTPGDAATVSEICAKVMGCGGYGWEDLATCEAGWIDSTEHGTQCADTDAYLSCMPACLDVDCDAFSTCETDCWVAHCQ